MQKDSTPADEIALYCISHLYNCHIKVYTSSYCWSTLQNQFTMMPAEISELSDVHLLYIRPGHFAEIKRIRVLTTLTPTSQSLKNICTVTPKGLLKDKPGKSTPSLKPSNKVHCKSTSKTVCKTSSPKPIPMTVMNSELPTMTSRYNMRTCIGHFTGSAQAR